MVGIDNAKVNVMSNDVKTYNLDEELEAKFEELFGENPRKENISTEQASRLIEVIRKKREKSVVDSFFSYNGEVPDSESSVQHLKIKSLIPIEKKHIGKHFSIFDIPGNKTLVYEIYACVDSSTDSEYCLLKCLESTETISANGNIERTFYIEDPQEKGNHLLILTLSSDSVLVNNGILLGSEVRVSKKPSYFSFNTTIKGTPSIHLNSSCCDISGFSDAELLRIESGEIPHEYEARIDSDILIIDPVTQEALLRKPYFDNVTLKWKSKIDLIPSRSYFACRVQHHTGEIRKPLSASTVGRHLVYGSMGYQKDIERGISYLEKDGSPDSLFVIAEAFFDEASIRDETIAKEYLFESAEKGCIDAIAECFALSIVGNLKEQLLLLDNVTDNESEVWLFIKAAINEYLCTKSDDEILKAYYMSAQKGFKPAQYRLSEYISNAEDAWHLRVSFTEALEYYKNTKALDNGDFEYCLGSVLLYGIGIASTSRTSKAGRFLMQMAINKGNINAIYELWDYCVNCDPGLLEDYLSRYVEVLIEHTTDADKLNRIANALFDSELDRDFCDKVAVIALEKALAIDGSNSVAINNLGWAYMNARGCKCDYKRAVDLFLQSSSLGSRASFYHLGCICEKGLETGTPNIEKAISYYQKAADMGHKKSAIKVTELREQRTTCTDDPLQQILSNQKRIQATLGIIDERTLEMQNQLLQITRFTEHDLQKWLRHEKSRLEENIELNDEASIAESISRSNEYINQQVGNANGLVDKETEELRMLFGGIWNKLLPTTQASLISARVLWQSCIGITREDFDYSGICISSTSALECELRRWFYVGYQEYLIKVAGNPSEMDPSDVWNAWPEELLNMDRKTYRKMVEDGRCSPMIELGDAKSFTMGKLPYLFWNKKNRVTRDRMKEYLDTIFKEEYRQKPGGTIGTVDWIDFRSYKRDPHSFISDCDNIRDAYRNPAAHSGIVCRSDAEICCQRVIGRVDAYRHCSEVQGLIMTLYNYLKV